MGYGDHVMVTGFARLAKQRNPNLQVIIGNKKMATYMTLLFLKIILTLPKL